jgi:hypothetical protein
MSSCSALRIASAASSMPASGIVSMDTRTTELIVNAPLVHVSAGDQQWLRTSISQQNDSWLKIPIVRVSVPDGRA